MNICTPHFVLKLAPADNRGWPRQMQMGHEVFVHISSPISHHSFLTRLPQAPSGESDKHVPVDVEDPVSDAHESVVQSYSALVECEPAEPARPPRKVRIQHVSSSPPCSPLCSCVYMSLPLGAGAVIVSTVPCE